MYISCQLAETCANFDAVLFCLSAITCSSPPNVTGGTHDGGRNSEKFAYNATVTYSCDNGFLLIGEASIHCITEDKAKGIWSGPVPECKGNSLRPSLSLYVRIQIHTHIQNLLLPILVKLPCLALGVFNQGQGFQCCGPNLVKLSAE